MGLACGLKDQRLMARPPARAGGRGGSLTGVEGKAAGRQLPKGEGIQRYKGLGEMSYQELWETTMDPDHRILKQVQIEDAAAADETFSMLMGDEVEPRRLFIQRNARNVSWIDA